MAKLLKLRRGTTSQHSSFTGAEGEVTVDTTKDTAVVHDGSTAGGHPLVKENAEVTSAGIASNVVDEDNLKVSNSPTNGHFLQAQSGNTGGLTWAAVSQTPEGTAVLSTGESGGTKFLREDGDNSCSWQTVPIPTPTVVAVTDESTQTSCHVWFSTTATGNLAPRTGTNLTFNSNTGILTATGFAGDITGDVTGNVTGNTSGSSGSCTGNAATATAATTATNVTVAAESSDTSCNVLFTTAATGDLPPKSGTNLTFNSSTGDLTATILTDGKGNVRSIPQNTQGSTYTLVASDAGKHIWASGTVTVPNSVFSAGDAVTIVNNTASNLTITKTITTMYNAADGSSANRTLATRGMATILFVSGTVAYISGSGLS